MIKEILTKDWGIHRVWSVYGSIDKHDSFRELIESLDNAKVDDTYLLKINSPGGSVSVGMMLVQALKRTEATVVAHVVHPSASMASLISLSCDYLVASKNSYLMFHNYSGGSYGKGDELVQHVVVTDDVLKQEFTDICYPFLSKREIRNMFDGKDIYITDKDEDLKERIERHFEMTDKIEQVLETLD